MKQIIINGETVPPSDAVKKIMSLTQLSDGDAASAIIDASDFTIEEIVYIENECTDISFEEFLEIYLQRAQEDLVINLDSDCVEYDSISGITYFSSLAKGVIVESSNICSNCGSEMNVNACTGYNTVLQCFFCTSCGCIERVMISGEML